MTKPYNLFMDAVAPKIVEHFHLPARGERLLAPPKEYLSGPIATWLDASTGRVGKLWHHQALALQKLSNRRNVVLSTPTGSGKSKVYQAAIINEILRGGGVAILFYPQKALSGDQLVSWRAALRDVGLPETVVGEINGDVPMSERDHIFDKARIVVMTPDTGHAWLMRLSGSPSAQSFLARLRFIVIDEAHSFDGVFGSNSAFFFRRLRSAAAMAKAAVGNKSEIQFIASTATIHDPQQHMADLTGVEFDAISDEDNGAPFHGLDLFHIEGPANGAPGEKMFADVISKVASAIAPKAVIGFADTRQGAERITRTIGRDDTVPYRGGYDPRDRRDIEAGLRSGTLRGVVSTSCLEQGIDISHFTVGLTLGVPATRKSLRQRAGRVGRASEGVFAVVAPPSAFRQLGMTFSEFYLGAPEPSHLYLGNKFIQFQQARCLIEELGAGTELPADVNWPEGFAETFALAQPGSVRPRELDAMVSLVGAGSPHLAFPLRRIGDVTYGLRHARGTTDKIGTIEIDKAMREAYPGATYYHMKRPYRVVEWRTKSYEQLILLEPGCNGGPTRPMLRTLVNMALEHDAIIDDRCIRGDTGCLAEIMVGVHESVEGYTIGSTQVPYRDASKTDPRLSRKQREFSTTGVALRINADWFKGGGDHQVAARRALARALETLLSRNQSIAPGDIRSVHTGVGLLTPSGPRKIDDAIVVFDTAQGGLRLTAPLFDELDVYLERLSKGAELAGEEALVSSELVERVREWSAGLSPATDIAGVELSDPSEDLIVFEPGSEIALKVRGALIHRRLLEPQLVEIDDCEKLMYRYESQPGVHALVAHDRIEPVGQSWRKVFWNPVSNAMREIEA